VLAAAQRALYAITTADYDADAGDSGMLRAVTPTPATLHRRSTLAHSNASANANASANGKAKSNANGKASVDVVMPDGAVALLPLGIVPTAGDTAAAISKRTSVTALPLDVHVNATDVVDVVPVVPDADASREFDAILEEMDEEMQN
jgi:hypothetical protein